MLGLVFIVAGFWRPEQDGGTLYQIVYFFQRAAALRTRVSHARRDRRVRPLVLYTSMTVFCLFLKTVRSLERRRMELKDSIHHKDTKGHKGSDEPRRKDKPNSGTQLVSLLVPRSLCLCGESEGLETR